MHQLFKLFFLFLILSSQGCQILKDYQIISLQPLGITEEQNQIQILFDKGKQLDALNKDQRRYKCKQLKQQYKIKTNWETAWLLIYSLNDNFNCLSLHEALDILTTMQAAKDINKQLQWLNKNQIKLLKDINTVQRNSNKVLKRNKYIRSKLNQATKQVEELDAKIQELKAIETSINKKTQ